MFLSPQDLVPNLDCSDLFEPTNDDCAIKIKDDHFVSYFNYMGDYLSKIGMTVSIHQNLPHLYFYQDNSIEKILPLPTFQVYIFDDDEFLSKFSYHQFNIAAFFDFNEWIKDEVQYYVKSKELCRIFEKKFAKKSFKKLL